MAVSPTTDTGTVIDLNYEVQPAGSARKLKFDQEPESESGSGAASVVNKVQSSRPLDGRSMEARERRRVAFNDVVTVAEVPSEVGSSSRSCSDPGGDSPERFAGSPPRGGRIRRGKSGPFSPVKEADANSPFLGRTLSVQDANRGGFRGGSEGTDAWEASGVSPCWRQGGWSGEAGPDSDLFKEVSPAAKARIARTVSSFRSEVPAMLGGRDPLREKRQLLQTRRSLQLGGFLVDEEEEAGVCASGEEEAEGSTEEEDGLRRTGSMSRRDESDVFPVLNQAGGLSAVENAQAVPAANVATLRRGYSMNIPSPDPERCGAVSSSPPFRQKSLQRLPHVIVVPISANFDTANRDTTNFETASFSTATPSPPPLLQLRRQLSEIPEDPGSHPSSPGSYYYPAPPTQISSPLRRQKTFSDTPRPGTKLKRSFSEAPEFARELLRHTSLSTCQESHEGPCFSSQMIDALVLSRAVYEHSVAEIMYYVELSRMELPCGAFKAVAHGSIETMRNGKKVHRKLAAQPYVVVQSSHGHYLVGCRGTDNTGDMLQDIQIVHKRFLGLGAAHWGFVQRAHSVDIQPMLDLLAQGEHLVVTGHSMGGAVAALLTLRILEATSNEVRSQLQCITFGCPLFANGDLADHINTEYREIFCHILAKNDAIPRMLPLLAGIFNLAMGSSGGEHPLDALAAVDLVARILRPTPLGPLAGGMKALINGVDGAIPRRLKWVLKALIRVALPPYSAMYAAAGHMVFLDRDNKSFLPFSSELKSVRCQLGFALGIANPDLFREHEISYYMTHVGESTQPWLEKFGCGSAGGPSRPGALTRGVSLGPGSPLSRAGSMGVPGSLNRVSSIGVGGSLKRAGSIKATGKLTRAGSMRASGPLTRMASVGAIGAGSPGAQSPGVGFGMGLRSGGRIPGCEVGLDLDFKMRRSKPRRSESGLCLDRLFESEEELSDMVNAASDFENLPVMTPSPQPVTPTNRRNMRLRATCSVSFKCRGLVGLPVEEPATPKPRKKRGLGRCFGFLRHVGRITRVAKSFEDMCVAYTSFRVVSLVVTHLI